MMEKLNDAVAWYQHKIGSYDKQLWETSVEEKVIQSIKHVPKKTAKVKPELIDVDLVRGSTFTKAKPQHGWVAVSKKGLVRVLFLPLYFHWWRRQTCLSFTLLALFLYLLQLGVMVIYYLDTGQNVNSEVLSLAHLVVPMVLMLTLGTLHSQIVATQMSHRQKRHSSKRQPKQRSRKKKVRPKYKNSTTSCETGSHNATLLSYCGLRQRRGKNNFHQQASDSSSGEKRERSDQERLGSEEENNQCEEEKNSHPKKTGQGNKTPNGPIANGLHEVKIQTSQRPNPKSVLNGEAAEKSPEDDIIIKTAMEALDGNLSYVSADGEQTTANSQECVEDLGQILESSGELFLPNKTTSSFHLAPNLVLPCSEENPPRSSRSVSKDQCVPCSSSGTNMEQNTAELLVDSSNDLGENCQPHKLEAPEIRQWALGDSNKTGDRLAQDGSGLAPDSASDRGRSRSRSLSESRGQKLAGSHHKEAPDVETLTRPQTLSVAFAADTPSNGGTSCESEGEITPNLPATPKGQTSEVDWEESMNTGVTCTSSSESSTESSTSPEITDDNMGEEEGEGRAHNLHHVSSVLNNLASSNDKVSCMIWEDNEVKKVDLTVMDIGWMIIKKVDTFAENSDYLFMGLTLSILSMVLPLAFRAYHGIETLQSLRGMTLGTAANATLIVIGGNWRVQAVVLNGVLQRLFLSILLFFLLSVAERTFKQRLQYAKHFCYLTSSRRARKYELPHFRLNKVRNIKTWLSLRSYLKKRGPQRSVDSIVSAAFFLAVVLVSIMCLELLQDSGGFLDHLGNWELVIWGLALGIYLLRFITLGTNINRKYRNFSVLITEQINLYLHMEKKPHKKDELMLANNVLKLAEELLKELESPFKVSGLSANPFLYNITKVIILSAFSAVLTELLGFKLKLYKIKLRT